MIIRSMCHAQHITILGKSQQINKKLQKLKRKLIFLYQDIYLRTSEQINEAQCKNEIKK